MILLNLVNFFVGGHALVAQQTVVSERVGGVERKMQLRVDNLGVFGCIGEMAQPRSDGVEHFARVGEADFLVEHQLRGVVRGEVQYEQLSCMHHGVLLVKRSVNNRFPPPIPKHIAPPWFLCRLSVY